MLAALAVIAAGLASRAVETGFILFDKYIGDALYAALFYCLGRACFAALPSTTMAITTMSAMIAIELFQLTLIPAGLAGNPNAAVRILARLLGTHFAWQDLAAYAAGVVACRFVDRPT